MTPVIVFILKLHQLVTVSIKFLVTKSKKLNNVTKNVFFAFNFFYTLYMRTLTTFHLTPALVFNL